jgi:hypothetical protein
MFTIILFLILLILEILTGVPFVTNKYGRIIVCIISIVFSLIGHIILTIKYEVVKYYKDLSYPDSDAIAQAVQSVTTDDTGAPKSSAQNELPETSRPLVPWTEPGFSSASNQNRQPPNLKPK